MTFRVLDAHASGFRSTPAFVLADAAEAIGSVPQRHTAACASLLSIHLSKSKRPPSRKPALTKFLWWERNNEEAVNAAVAAETGYIGIRKPMSNGL